MLIANHPNRKAANKKRFVVRLPRPHAGQQHVLNTARRYNYLCAGRRWRKTTMAATNVMIERALKHRGFYIWGSPTSKQARIAWEEAKKGLGLVGYSKQSPVLLIKLLNGSVIYFLSLKNYDDARGFTADGVVIDEVQDVKPEAISEVIMPMLLDTQGWLWCIGTSNGKDHFWEMRQQAKDDPDSMSWTVPTLGVRIENGQLIRHKHPYENPTVPFDEILRFYRKLPTHVFRREFMSDDDAAPGGLVYDAWLDDYDENPDSPMGNVTNEAEYNKDLDVYWGVDYGYVGTMNKFGYFNKDAHPFVIGFYQVQPTGIITRFDELLACRVRDDEMIKRALERPYKRPSYVALDSSASSTRGLLERTFGLYVKGKPPSVLKSITELRRWIAPDENGVRCFLMHPRCKQGRFDYKNYRYKDGTVEPQKNYDHCPDEGRYFVWTRRQSNG